MKTPDNFDPSLYPDPFQGMKELFDKHGWGTGHWHNMADGTMCLLGAKNAWLQHVVFDLPWEEVNGDIHGNRRKKFSHPLQRILSDIMHTVVRREKFGGRGCRSVAEFNDGFWRRNEAARASIDEYLTECSKEWSRRVHGG